MEQFTNSKQYCMELIDVLEQDGFFSAGGVTKSHMYKSMKPIADENLNSIGYCNLDKTQFIEAMAFAFQLMMEDEIDRMVMEGDIEIFGSDDEGNLLYNDPKDEPKDNPTDFFSLN
jgi:hypothetical protein